MAFSDRSAGASADLARIAVAPRRFAGDPHAAGAWRSRQVFFERTLLEHVAAARALPVGLHLPSPGDAVPLAEHYARLCDGLLLQGGADIGSALSKVASDAVPDTERDTFELALIAAFERRDKPILGICRGMKRTTLWARPSKRCARRGAATSWECSGIRSSMVLAQDGSTAAA
jgi:hypothetical protein